jgi:lipopolysaccharide transport system ATP-binding protein
VGDAEFQKKAIGKMQNISREGGRTVLFVSHNMAAVRSLCTRGVLIENGTAIFDGSIEKTIARYLRGGIINIKLIDNKNRNGNGVVLFESVKVYGEDENIKPTTGKSMTILFKILNKELINSEDIRFDIRIDDDFGQRLVWASTILKGMVDIENPNEIKLKFDKNPFEYGVYFATIYLGVKNQDSDWIDNAFSFEVEEGDFFLAGIKAPKGQRKINIDFDVVYK